MRATRGPLIAIAILSGAFAACSTKADDTSASAIQDGRISIVRSSPGYFRVRHGLEKHASPKSAIHPLHSPYRSSPCP